MRIKKTAMATALILVSGAANSVPITSLEITGGNFVLGGAGGVINPAAFSNMTVGGYDGSAPLAAGSEAFYAPTSIATLTYDVFGPVAIFTTESDGIRSGFSAPTGDITGSTLTLDLSAWTIYWNNSVANLGSSSDLTAGSICDGTLPGTFQPQCSTPILTTYNAMTGEFTASWNAVTIGGVISTQLSEWTITGYVSAVPVPAAAWLFGSGLIGLIGFARKNARA